MGVVKVFFTFFHCCVGCFFSTWVKGFVGQLQGNEPLGVGQD